MSTDDNEVLIKAEHVSKKFCRSLKRSLWYGVQDVTHSLMPWSHPPSYENGDLEDAGVPQLRQNEFWALQDISFEVRRGECLGLVGHNGAGKSTLLKILNGLNRPDTGRITMRGRVGALIELSAGFNPILTGRENIYNQATLLGFNKQEIDAKFDAIVDFSELEEFLDMPVQNYSSGMKMRLGFATVSQLKLDILLIDEVLAVGDMGFIFKCLNRMGEIMPETAVIFVSHSMPMVARICNQVMLLESGQPKLHTFDVAEGILSYLSGFSGLESKDLGNGAVVLNLINLEQKKGAEMYEVSDSFAFENGNSLTINLDFEICLEPNEEVFICVKIYDQQLRECINSFSNDASNAYYILAKGSLNIQVDFPLLYLNGGLHYISVASEGAKSGKIYCCANNVSTFMVRSKIHGWATSILPGKWKTVS